MDTSDKSLVVSLVAPRVHRVVPQLESLIERPVIALPFETIVPLDCPSLELALSQTNQMNQTTPCWWVAVSPSAADCLALRCGERRNIGSVLGLGAGTKQALAEHGFSVRALPVDAIDAREFLQVLARFTNAMASSDLPAKVHIVMGTKSQTNWRQALGALGLANEVHPCYERQALNPSLPEHLLSKGIRAWALPSETAVRTAYSLSAGKGVEQVLCPHPRLVSLAQTLGFRQAGLYQPGIQGLASALQSAGGKRNV